MPASRNRFLVGFLTSLAIVLYSFWNPFQLDAKAHRTLAVGLLMISFWILEILPMPVVALFPMVLFPLLGIAGMHEVSQSYADPIIYLFLGGFLIALAIEKWKLHQRIALDILSRSGSNGNQILLGFMLSTFLISMWLSNTATTMMMFPIALAVLSVLGDSYKEHQMKAFRIGLLISIAYSANIGGVATIIGTPPNTAFVGYINNHLENDLGFISWLIIGLPVSLGIIVLCYFLFTRVLFKNDLGKNDQMESFVSKQLDTLGPMSVPEKRVLVVFAGTALLWITKDLIQSIFPFELNDSIIALWGGIALFAIPQGLHQENSLAEDNSGGGQLLEWSDTKNLAWGILLLFGGGLALAKGLENSGIMDLIGEAISKYAPDNLFVLIIIIATVSIFLSEVMSNVAQVMVMAPILSAVSVNLELSPLILGIPMTLAASCAGMLPMGTPPNAIVYSTGQIPLKSMLRAGLWLNLLSIVVISILSYLIIPLIENPH